MTHTASATDAFLDAVKAGDLERVKEMISADPGLVDTKASTGESAVLTAVYHRHKEIANLLVARGAALTLAEACAAGERERAERLLEERAAEVNAYSADGWTPLHLAAFF